MTRLTTLIWMLVVVVAAFLLYMSKYQVQGLRVQVAEAERELEQEREMLHVVAAEWAYLNRPERLRALAARHLAVHGVRVDQIAEIEAVPFPRKVEAKAETKDGIQPAALKMQRGDTR